MATNARTTQMTHDSVVDAGASRAGRLAMGLVCGAAVGATLGLLLAPRSGQATRRQIAESADRARRRAADAYTQAQQAVGGVVEGGRRAVEAGTQAYRDARRAADTSRPTGVAVS